MSNPTRPLGAVGRAVWDRATDELEVPPGEDLLVVCEQLDERMALRVRVLRDNDVDDRKALRDLEARVARALRRLGLDPGSARVTSGLDQDLATLGDVDGRRALVAAARAMAHGLDAATVDGDHHAAVFLVRELRQLHGALLGSTAVGDPFDDFERELRTPLGHTPQP